MKIIIKFIQLIVIFAASVCSTEIWENFDIALVYRASRVLNNVILSFLLDSKSPLLANELDWVYGIIPPINDLKFVSSENSYPELEQSYINLIKKIMKIPILDHGENFKMELENLSIKLLSKTCSKVSSKCKNTGSGQLNDEDVTKTQLKQLEQTQIVYILVSELCKITELANSYWDSELDELTYSFLSNLGYKGKHISKIHKNYLYNVDQVGKRQRMDFYKNFGGEIKKYQNFILELNQQIKEFMKAPRGYKLDSINFDKPYFKYFPHEYYSFVDWLTMSKYLKELKKKLIKEIHLNNKFDKEDIKSSIKFISGEINLGDYVKIIKNNEIGNKVYKILKMQNRSIFINDTRASNQVLLYDFETGKRFQVRHDALIKTMNIACVYGANKHEFFKELIMTKYPSFVKKKYLGSDENGKCGFVLLYAIISMLKGNPEIKNITQQDAIRAIEVLNYSLRFNEFPNGVIYNELKTFDKINMLGLTTPNLMKCGSLLLILIVNRYNSLTGKFPDYQECSLKSVKDIDKCKPTFIKMSNADNWAKALEISFSSALADLSFNDESISFWKSSIKSSRTDDASNVQGYAKCYGKCVNDLLDNKGVQNNIVLEILRQISWYHSSDMMLLDKLVAKFHSLINIQVSSAEKIDGTSVSERIYNSLKHTVCNYGCYTYEPDSVILGVFRWMENKSNHVQKIHLINYYYLGFNIHSRFVEFLKMSKIQNPMKYSKKFTKFVLHKFYKLLSIYTHSEFMPPLNYPFASYVLQIIFFLNESLDNYRVKWFQGSAKNFKELAKAIEPSSLSNVYKFEKLLKVLRKYAIKFIFKFMTNNKEVGDKGVVEYFKYKFMKGFSPFYKINRIINDGNNASLKYGPLAIATVLSWALNGQEIVPKYDSEQWKPYVSSIFSSPNIPQYRKIFFYMILNNAKSPEEVARDIILKGCQSINPKVVKRKLLNVLSAKNNILLVIDMAMEIANNCGNTNYKIETSWLFTESKCNDLKLAAVKSIKLDTMKNGKLIKFFTRDTIKKRLSMAKIECDWFYNSGYYKSIQKKIGGNRDDYINHNLIENIRSFLGYKEFKYEYVSKDVFITGVHDYYSLLFDNLGNCNKTDEIENAGHQYENFIEGSKKQILLQEVYDGNVYLFKNPAQTLYKFGRVFLTEKTLDRLLINDIKIPECNGKCHIDDFRRVTVRDELLDELGNPIIRPQSIKTSSALPALNVVNFPQFIFKLYIVQDIVNGELITIDDVIQGNVLVCADGDFYHDNIDVESVKYGGDGNSLLKYPAFGYKFFKKTNTSKGKNKCGYYLANVSPDPSEDSNYKDIKDPVEAMIKNIAQIAIEVK